MLSLSKQGGELIMSLFGSGIRKILLAGLLPDIIFKGDKICQDLS